MIHLFDNTGLTNDQKDENYCFFLIYRDIDFISNGIRNNSQYMYKSITGIDEKLRKQRPKNGAKDVFIHFDNSLIYKSKESLKKNFLYSYC